MRPGGATAAAPGPADKGVRPHVVSTSAIRGVLFDKDGTLVDFRATWVPAYLGVAGELAARLGGGAGAGGRPPPAARLRPGRGDLRRGQPAALGHERGDRRGVGRDA